MANTLDTKRLRQKLLDLAVRGKLVPQDPNDEPASELLARIHDEKLEMAKRGELKSKDVKNDTVIYYASDGLPYEKQADGKGEATQLDKGLWPLPDGWAWTRMHSIAHVEAGKTPAKESFVKAGIPYFKMYNLRNQSIDFEYQPQYIKPEVHYGQLAKSRIHPGDLIMNIVGPPLGKLAIVPDAFPEANTNQAAVVIRPYSPYIPSKWLFYYLSQMSEINSVSTRGSAGQVNISVNQSRDMFVAVPPLSEQRRIVAALDKYLSLVDTIERDGEELGALFGRLRSKVLDLAIRGELTERDPSDEPAGELLARIHDEKLAMVGRGELKPKDVSGDTVIYTGSDGLRYEKPADGKGEPVCIEDEIPFEIPEGWAWARLGSLATFSGGGTPEKRNPAYWDGEMPWASVKDMHGDRLTATINSITSEGLASKPSISICHPGQIIVATRLVPGKTIISGIECAINQDLKVVNTLLPAEYLSIWFKAHLTEFGHIGSGTTVPGIKLSELESALVVLPPLAEQQRIAERVETILCQLR